MPEHAWLCLNMPGLHENVVKNNSNGKMIQVSCLGDTDGDGKEELAVGAPFASETQVSNNDHVEHKTLKR